MVVLEIGNLFSLQNLEVEFDKDDGQACLPQDLPVLITSGLLKLMKLSGSPARLLKKG